MLTFKKHVVNGLEGFRVLAGANVLGTAFYWPDEPGMSWRGVAPDGTRFSATSRPKLAQKLQIHAAAIREAKR